ncbi:MAG: TPM domain-containing protein [Lachnospiraceae bacterium]|nr:TPM domain-containing protein [Lachnospiraceae bacterium]
MRAKRIPVLPLLLVLSLYLSTAVLASEAVYTNAATGYGVYIDDQADLLTEEEEASLAAAMRAVTGYGNVIFLTTDYNRTSAGSYAKDYIYTNFGNASGALFLIDMDNREIYLCCEGAISKIITNSYCNSITDNIYTYATDGDYLGCAKGAFSQVYTLMEGGRIAQPMKYISLALFSMAAAVLINFLVLVSSRNNFNYRAKKSANFNVQPGSSAGTADGLNPIVPAILGTALISSHIRTVSSSDGGGSSSGGGGGGGGGFSGSGGGHSF